MPSSLKNISGCVSEREIYDYLNINFKNSVINVDNEWVSLKFTSKFENPGIPEAGMLLPGHPGGVNWFEWEFLTTAGLCDLGKQGKLFTKAIMVTHSC